MSPTGTVRFGILVVMVGIAASLAVLDPTSGAFPLSPRQGQIIEYGPGDQVILPEPFATPSARNRSQVIGWPPGRTPQAPPGFRVTLFAENLGNPREFFVVPNGDILVVESEANRITLFRDRDGDGKPEFRSTLLAGLNRPHGMALIGSFFYVGNTDGVVRYPYQPGQSAITVAGTEILDLPTGGHYTRNLMANPQGTKLYVAVGSRTNVDESGEDARDPRRAAILEINPDGSGLRVFASGLRNPVGMDWEPSSKTLWTVVNERDGLGDQLVPDYLTQVREGAFYGWPYSYFGRYEDPRKKDQRPDLVAKATVPDYALGAHTASLGLRFYTHTQFPEKYRGGAFIGQHGSWNRSHFAGYKVIFLPFRDGKPSGPLEDFLTGFVHSDTEVYGRPVGVAVSLDGSLLVADDESDRIWHIRYVGR